MKNNNNNNQNAHRKTLPQGFHGGSAEDMGQGDSKAAVLFVSCNNDQPYVKSDGKVPADLKARGITVEVYDVDQVHVCLTVFDFDRP